ncbi:MAG: energy transducer TonB [Pseudomonadota bacterium]|nr:energy transducer TonB [Pseudomonadota bacterium]
MAEQDKPESGLKRLTATLGRSAEYSIALGLIVVCVIVGGALWLPDTDRKVDENPVVSAPTQTPGRYGSKIADEEKAALAGWNQQLEGDFKEIEQAQRRAAEEAAQRERQRQEAERTQRAAELERQQALAASAAAAAKQTRRPTATTAPTAVPAKVVVRVEPAIDWSSCRRPDYPDISVKRREQGVVGVDVDLDAAGKVLRSRVAQSSGHSRLDAVTQRAVERCRFSPATVGGVAQAATATVRFTWKLQD